MVSKGRGEGGRMEERNDGRREDEGQEEGKGG